MITVNEPAEFDSIVDLLHDCWFDLSAVRWDLESATVTIPFDREALDRAELVGGWFLKTFRVPVVRWLLTVHHVRDCFVEDPADVGRVDFNELRYDADVGLLVIDTDVPSDIRIHVDSLALALENTGAITGERLVKRMLTPR